jgi:hypothetical protein
MAIQMPLKRSWIERGSCWMCAQPARGHVPVQGLLWCHSLQCFWAWHACAMRCLLCQPNHILRYTRTCKTSRCDLQVLLRRRPPSMPGRARCRCLQSPWTRQQGGTSRSAVVHPTCTCPLAWCSPEAAVEWSSETQFGSEQYLVVLWALLGVGKRSHVITCFPDTTNYASK